MLSFSYEGYYSRGLVGKFNHPDSDTFDVDVNVTLVRSHFRKIQVHPDYYKHFVDHAASFDYLEYGANGTYALSFWCVRFKLSEDTYECLVTNLPRKEFDIQKLKLLYFAR